MTMQNITKKFVPSIALLAFTAGLVACSTPQPYAPPMVNKNKIRVAESIERLELYTRPTGLELSARDQVAVGQFLQGYGSRGEGPLYINVPSSTARGIGAQQAQNVIRQSLSQLGMSGAPVQTGQYQSASGAPAPVVVSYRTLKTIPQDCRDTDDLGNSFANQPYSSFGCHSTANLAAMVNDPRQFIEPYGSTPPDSQRRQVVYDKYIAGEDTSSTQPERQEVTTED